MGIFSLSIKAEERCASMSIKTLPLVEEYCLPIDPKELIVQIDEFVNEGQVLIKDHGDNILLHSPVSGVFQEIRYVNNQSFMIIHASTEQREFPQDINDPFTKSPDILIEEVRKAGIIGMGGAGFPTFKKLQLAKGNVDTIIINAVECEPFLSSDVQLLLTYPMEIIQGVKAIQHIVGAEKVVIAIHENKELFTKINAYTNENISIVEVPSYYPSGYEKTLIREIKNIELDYTQLSFDAKVLVNNVATIKAVYDALFLGKPLIERTMSIDGAFCKEFGNFLVKIGTPITQFVKPYADNDICVMISGGPMMGTRLSSEQVCDKVMNGLLIIEEKIEEQPEVACIRCSSCVTHCPMRLEPFRLIDMVRHQEWDYAIPLGIMECISCNVCTYVCPSHIPLGNTIFSGKQDILRSR